MVAVPLCTTVGEGGMLLVPKFPGSAEFLAVIFDVDMIILFMLDAALNFCFPDGAAEKEGRQRVIVRLHMGR